MAPPYAADGSDFVGMQEEEEEGESSPFLTRGQEPRSRALLRSGSKLALGLAAALLACAAAAAMINGGHRGGGGERPRAFLGFDGLVQQQEVSENGNATGNATEACPAGYIRTHLDMQNHDADMHEESASLEECAAKCNGDEECKGFEHNVAAGHCWVSRAGHHCTDEQHEDWISCVKGGSDACEGGGNATGNVAVAAMIKGGGDASNATSDGNATGDGNATSPGNATAAPESPRATETCPDGYVATHLDVQNHDADMHQETASLEDCAAKCNEDGDCKGFEHNIAAQTCWVSRAGHHCTDEQQEGWISCVKGGSDACEDGGPNDE